MKTRPANNNITITKPEAILDAALREALAPFAKELREAAARDIELAAAAAEVHPEAGRKRAAELFEAAVQGSKAAADELEAGGGVEKYHEHFSKSYRHRDGMRHAAAERCAALFSRVAEVVAPAVRVAGDQIAKQYADTLVALSELPAESVSQWDAKIRSIASNIESAPRNASLGHGAAYIIDGLGFRELIK